MASNKHKHTPYLSTVRAGFRNTSCTGIFIPGWRYSRRGVTLCPATASVACICRQGGCSSIRTRKGSIIIIKYGGGVGTSQSRSDTRRHPSGSREKMGRSALGGGWGCSLTWGGHWKSQTATGWRSDALYGRLGRSGEALGSYQRGRGRNILCRLSFTEWWSRQFCSSCKKHG